MTSEELMKKAWDTIRENERKAKEEAAKTAEEDEAVADKILEKIPQMINEAMAKGIRMATVIYLNEKSLEKLEKELGRRREQVNIKRGISTHDPVSKMFEDLYYYVGSPRMSFNDEESVRILTGADKVIYQKLREAKLNPYIGHDPKDKWGIGIRW